MSRFRMAGFLARLAVALAFLAPVAAGAAITCSIAVTSVSTSFNNALGTNSLTSGAYTISCTRLSNDPNSLTYTLGANNGLHAAGQQNRAQNAGGTNLNYELYRIPTIANGNRWQDNNAALRFGPSTITFAGASTSTQTIGTFYLNVPTAQNPAAGTYTDTVTANLRDSTGVTILNSTTFNVTIDEQAACQITSPPGNLNFTYTSFQNSAATASSTFAVRCTNGHAYSMGFDASSASLLGLTYTLGLSQTTANGTGNSQTFTINGNIASGQAGTCATATCSGTQTRTLIVTY